MTGRLRAALATAVLAASALSFTSSPAQADPVPAPYTGSTHGDILALDAEVLSTVVGADTLSATVAHSATAVDSEATPRSHAESANLDTAVAPVGVDVGLVQPEADAPPSSTYDRGLGEVDALPLLDTGLLTGAGAASWAGDAACVTPGSPIATSTTRMAGATVGDLTLPLSDVPLLGLTDLDLVLAQVGAASTTGTVMLSPNGATNDVVSTATSTIATTSLVNDRVRISVADPVLTVTSDGTASTVDYSNPLVTVTADLDGDGIFEVNTTLQAEAGTLTLSVPLLDVGGLGVDTLTAGVTLSLAPDPTGATGADATASIPAVVQADVSLEATGAIATLLGSQIATVSLGLLPLTASALAPTGGVECALPAPVITSPADGDYTSPSPTIEGTGVPGATVTVVIDGEVVGTALVAADGTWTLPVAGPLAPGPHTVVATQALEGLVSPQSNAVDFVVPVSPVITAPADGSATTDTTPTISGTGEPGATVEVVVDGAVIGTATITEDGTWALDVTTPLAPGEHTVEATQSIEGIVLEAEPVTFLVTDVTPPVIESPEDGSTITDSTPVIAGTGEPGAEIEVVVDGESVGTVTVDADGNWALPLEEPLADGEHTVEAIQTAGDGSVLSDESTFTVDALDAPVITSPDDGSTTTDSTPVVEGTGEPGATVTVFVDGEEAGATTVDEDGNWSLGLDDALSCGEHTLTAVQVLEGVTSPASEPVKFTVGCPSGGAAGGDVLPSTGAAAGLGGLAVLGAALFAAGAWTLRRSRLTA